MNPRLSRWLVQWLPFVGVFAHGLGQSIVIATLPPLGREIGLKEVAIGAIISASSLVFFLCSRIWGRVSDRWGRKPVIVTGLSGYTIGTLVFAMFFAFGLYGVLGGTLLYGFIIATRMAQSAVMSATAPATAAYVADTTTSQTRSAGMGRLGAASNTGSILGPAIAGTLAAFSLLLPLIFAAIAAAIAALLILRYLPTEPVVARTHTPAVKLSFFDPRIGSFLGVGMVVFIGLSVVQQTLAFRIQDSLQLSARDTAQIFGYTMMIAASASLLAQTLLVQGLKLPPLLLLRGGVPLLALTFAWLIFSTSLEGFCIAMGMLGLGMGVSGPGINAATSLAVGAQEQGAAAGLATAVPALGFIIGPMAGSWLYQINPAYPYVFTTLLLLPTCVWVYRLRQHLHGESSLSNSDGRAL